MLPINIHSHRLTLNFEVFNERTSNEYFQTLKNKKSLVLTSKSRTQPVLTCSQMLVFSASHYHRLVFSAALGKTAERMVVGRHRTGWRVVPHCSTNDGQAALQLFSRTETELLQAPSNPPAAQGRGEQSGSREQRGVSREEERQAGSNLDREGASLVVRLTAGCWRRRVHQQLPHHLRSGQQAVSGLYNNDKSK